MLEQSLVFPALVTTVAWRSREAGPQAASPAASLKAGLALGATWPHTPVPPTQEVIPSPEGSFPSPENSPLEHGGQEQSRDPPPLRSLPPRSHPWPAAACQVCLPTATWPPSPSSSGAWPEHPATAARSSCAGQRLPGGKEGRGLLTRGHCRSWIKAESEHRLSPALEHPQLPHGPVDQGYGVLASVVGCVWGRKGSACWTADSHGIASSQCTRGAVWTQCPSSGASGLRLCHSRHLAGQFSPPV